LDVNEAKAGQSDFDEAGGRGTNARQPRASGADEGHAGMDWLRLLQECFDADRVYYTRHARCEMEADEFGRILDAEVHQAILAGEVIQEYAGDTPYPSVLLLGVTRQDRPLHVVCAYDVEERRAYVITVYQPDPARWIDFRTRRAT